LPGVAYGPRLKPGTEAHVEALKKRKEDAYNKTTGKCAKSPVKKKARVLKIVVLKAKSGVKRPSRAEEASLKSVKWMKTMVSGSLMTLVVGLCRSFVI
jgi:hypothetical protein